MATTIKHYTPKVYVIARGSTSREAISEKLKKEPMDLISFEDEKDYFASFDRAEVGCVLVEVSDNPQDQLKTIASIRAAQQRMQVIAFSDRWSVSTAVQAMKLGALDICEFPVSGNELGIAVHHALTNVFQDSRQLSQLIPDSMLEKLNSEEAILLRLVVQGRTAKEIGLALDISVRTFHYRKKSLLSKLGACDRSEAIELIRESIGSQGFIEARGRSSKIT